MPAVSVVMPVFDCADSVGAAIDSILAQTARGFELIVVNDASLDETAEIVEGFDDPRIKLVHNRQNRGISHSLNKGISLARGRFVARMDGDDVSLPDRFERQLSEFSRSESLGVVGSSVEAIEGDRATVWPYPEDWSAISQQLLFNTAVAHPTVMIRRDVLPDRPYDERFNGAEDYELWIRLVGSVKFKNISDPLLRYGFPGPNEDKERHQRELCRKIRPAYLGLLGLSGSEIDQPSHNRLSELDSPASLAELRSLLRWSKRLPRLLRSVGWPHTDGLDREIRWRWQEMLGRRRPRNRVTRYVFRIARRALGPSRSAATG